MGDASALTSQPAAVTIAGTFIKQAFANMSSHLTEEYVTVEIQPTDPMVADVQLQMQDETGFYEVVKALQDGEDALKTQFLGLLANPALAPFTTGPHNITDLVFNFSAIDFLTSTMTETPTPCSSANNCTTTTALSTTALIVSRGNHQIPLLSTMLMWFVAQVFHA